MTRADCAPRQSSEVCMERNSGHPFHQRHLRMLTWRFQPYTVCVGLVPLCICSTDQDDAQEARHQVNIFWTAVQSARSLSARKGEAEEWIGVGKTLLRSEAITLTLRALRLHSLSQHLRSPPSSVLAKRLFRRCAFCTIPGLGAICRRTRILQGEVPLLKCPDVFHFHS